VVTSQKPACRTAPASRDHACDRLRSNVLLIATGSRPALDPFGPFNVDYQGTVNLVTAAVAQQYKKVRIPGAQTENKMTRMTETIIPVCFRRFWTPVDGNRNPRAVNSPLQRDSVQLSPAGRAHSSREKSPTTPKPTAVVHRQVILVTSIGTDEPFFPLNLLWCAPHAPATLSCSSSALDQACHASACHKRKKDICLDRQYDLRWQGRAVLEEASRRGSAAVWT